MPNGSRHTWLHYLNEEDIAFVKKLVVASGSLKKVAAQYGISYPTVRLRLDRLIQKIRLLDESRPADPYELALRMEHAEGNLDLATLKRLLAAYEKGKRR